MMEYDVNPAQKTLEEDMERLAISTITTCQRRTVVQPNDNAITTSFGCCGILNRLICASVRDKTMAADNEHTAPPAYTAGAMLTTMQQNQRKLPTLRRRTPQEVYFESRGKSCKKLLKFNGSSNKILLYPEESWARTASSSYWTITPCWWHPNYCRIEEFTGNQRHTTKAKMSLEQKGSLLVSGHFRNKAHTYGGNDIIDEFKLYLTSNISMEDYNMGYCLTGFVERRCSHTHTFQMTHFAVIKRQWPSIKTNSDSKST